MCISTVLVLFSSISCMRLSYTIKIYLIFDLVSEHEASACSSICSWSLVFDCGGEATGNWQIQNSWLSHLALWPTTETLIHAVLQEMQRLDADSNVYKLIGPVLVKQDQDEAKQNVQKRIDYITTELWVHCSALLVHLSGFCWGLSDTHGLV